VIAAGLIAVWAAQTPLTDRSVAPGAGDAVAALRRPPVLAGMWLVALPALGFGCIAVLCPLRLDRLGASGTGVGAAFLVAAAAESVISPIAGRMSDRSGRLVPIRLGLMAAAVVLVCLTLPRQALGLAVAIVAAATALSFFWAPAMALLADAAERTGLHHGLAFVLVDLAWAAGRGTGSAAGGAGQGHHGRGAVRGRGRAVPDHARGRGAPAYGRGVTGLSQSGRGGESSGARA
jgi:MFS family permease